MAITVYPADAVAGAPSYSGRKARQALMAPHLAGATSARPLGARSGVRPGTSATTVTATSTTWTVAPHAGVLDLETAAEAGPYGYAIDANVTGSVNAAHASLARVDLISVRLDDPAESDGSSAPGVVVVYTAGTAGAGTPATPARCMVLATINVPASGGGSPSVTWVAPLLPTTIIPVRNQAERDAITAASAENPVYVDRLDLGVIQRRVGGAWTTYGPGIRFKGYLPAGTSVTTTTNIQFLVSEDTASAWNSSTYVWTCPMAGTYLLIGSVKNNSTGVSGNIRFLKNGSGAFSGPNCVSAAFGGTTASYIVRLAVGDTVSMQFGASYVTQNDAPADTNFFEITQVQL